MLSPLKPFSRSLLLPRHALHLHAMLNSCGYSQEIGAYDWHGLRRGRAEFALLQITTEGEGRLCYEQETQPILPGQAMMLHFPHDHRYWRPASSAQWSFYYFVLNGQMVLDAWRTIERQVGPVATLATDGPTIQVSNLLLQQAAADQLISAFQVSALAWKLTMTLAEEVLPHQVQPEQPDFVHRVRRYCRDHLAEPVGVAEMAAVAGYSRAHFSRAFSTNQGQPPTAYLRQLRIRRALRLLRTTGDTIATIGAACGFSDSSYFCKVFRQEVGMSPAEFRRSGT